MEYLNPTSIAGMFNTPKDTSLPGAGYGLGQGFLEGQAARQSQDFLDMSKASAAQDFVSKQFENQTKYEDRPFELQKKKADYQSTQAATRGVELENKKKEKLLEQITQNNQLAGVRMFGAAANSFERAKSPMERKMIWDTYVRQHQMSGAPVNDLIHWDGTEQGWNNIIRQAQLARDIASYHDEIAAKRAMTTEKEGGDTARNQAQITSAEKIAQMKANVDVEVAKIHAQAKTASEGGGNAFNKFKVEIGQAWQQAETKVRQGEPLTAADQAALIMGPRMLAGQFYSTERRTDPNVIGEGARKKASNEMQGTLEGLDQLNGGASFEDQSTPTVPSAQPQVPGTPGKPSLQDRLNRYQ